MSIENKVLPGDLKEAVELLERIEDANSRANMAIVNKNRFLLHVSQREIEQYSRRLNELMTKKDDHDKFMQILSDLDQRGLVEIKKVILEVHIHG
ncbi:hypothetical protein GCM10011391_28440 [Pullulanibacillus camelliae]|uniref:Uncharacterized protein n=1 Tax=Pullulanibacillus camelliae TaxID=1707096 RepID=A0A8J2YK39_9BACL|nr:hypothetical protein [Pullulanibacillus camelliae]GGE47968.1 hypothetical protein GCM10011391_28440 [Pullulanibacillus camelliae]